MNFLTSMFSGFIHDLHYGLRQFRRSPILAAVVVGSLALGIGANTAIFSVVNAVMLHDLPIHEPGRLMVLQYVEPEGGFTGALDHSHSGRGSRDRTGRSVGLSVSWPSFTYLAPRARSSKLAGFVPLGMFNRPTATVKGEPMFVDADMVTADFFPVLGVAPALGRVIATEDEKPGAPRVGVISHEFWRRVFAGSRDALGASILLNGVSVTIVGVAPQSFRGLENGRSPDVYIQMGPQPGLTPWGVTPKGEPQVVYAASDYWWLQVVARLTPGVPEGQARAELDRLFRESLLAGLDSPVPASKLPSVSLTPAAQGLNAAGRRFSTPLAVLAVVVGLVLLVACANVATLLLARASARRKEMAVRLAMGAPRFRLIRQLLAESLLYASAGAALGLVVAGWGSRALLVLLVQGRDPVTIDARLDPLVLAFTGGVALLTTVLFGLAPAVRATRVDSGADLKENAATPAAGRGRRRFGGGRLLVVAQIALSLPLVVGAGLFLRTLSNLERQQLGFDPGGILTFGLDPTKAGFKDARLLATFAEIQARVAALPAVRAVGASRLGLITGWVNNGSISLEGRGTGPDAAVRGIHWNQVSAGFFTTMGMELVLGRAIDARDGGDAPNVAVVNHAFAARCFPGENPVGRRFWFGRTPEGQPIEIVGVVRDAKYSSLRAPAPPTAYVPYTQSRTPLTSMVFQVRAGGDPMALVGSVRKIVADVAPGVPLADVKTQARQIEESLSQETMYARLFGFFGLVALLLACVGLYATLSYALGRRTREIGIRMALGAGQGRVLGSVLLETVVLALVGLAAGTALALAGGRFVRGLLFEVTPVDPPTLAAAVIVMLAVTLVAGYLPARRASRLDPLRALRAE
jgi:predicted permease